MRAAVASNRRRVATSREPRPYVPSLDTLEEITQWLGTFRERMRIAHASERSEVVRTVIELEAHFERRRAELA